MPDKLVVMLKSIGRKWFLILVVVIVIIYFINQLVAIWMTIITLVLYAISFIPLFFFNYRLKKYMKNFYAIEDKAIARNFKRPLKKIQDKMFKLSQKQKKKNSLIIFLNKQYIYYNQTTIEKYKQFYSKGFGEKEMLEKLKKLNIKTRSEVKAIEEILIRNERLQEREISVKDYRQSQRFS